MADKINNFSNHLAQLVVRALEALGQHPINEMTVQVESIQDIVPPPSKKFKHNDEADNQYWFYPIEIVADEDSEGNLDSDSGIDSDF